MTPKTAVRCFLGGGALVLAFIASSAFGAPKASAANKPHVVCIFFTSSGTHWMSQKRPHSCVFHRRNKQFDSADLAPVDDIRWRHWGRRHASGSGILRGNMGFKSHVHISLKRPRHGYPHRRLYFSRLGLRGTKGVDYHINLDVPHSNRI